MHQTLPNFYIEKYLNLMQRILIIEWGGGRVELITELIEDNLRTASNQ